MSWFHLNLTTGNLSQSEGEAEGYGGFWLYQAQKFRRSWRPGRPLFSGWNWKAMTLSRAAPEANSMP